MSLREVLSLRPGDLKKPEYRHLWLLLYWVIEIPLFFLVERLPLERHVVFCALDEQIPFCEIMIVPYVLWFLCCVFMTVYTLFRDVPGFRRFMRYMIVTALASFAFYVFWPSYFPGQPDPVPGNSVFTRLVELVYRWDEPVNIFPSEHVIVALGMAFAALHSRKLRRPAFSVPFTALQLLICCSVVFVKQHSALDVLGALPVAALGWFTCYYTRKKAPRGCGEAEEKKQKE